MNLLRSPAPQTAGKVKSVGKNVNSFVSQTHFTPIAYCTSENLEKACSCICSLVGKKRSELQAQVSENSSSIVNS